MFTYSVLYEHTFTYKAFIKISRQTQKSICVCHAVDQFDGTVVHACLWLECGGQNDRRDEELSLSGVCSEVDWSYSQNCTTQISMLFTWL
uniref:Uncharacterized protein n=1 Tax=Anguilla anguilla TaxID=7936 RepID=A0A0E9WU03_ANGAN